MLLLRCLVPLLGSVALAQSVVNFSFDNAPPYTPLPIDVTVSGVTAHLAGGYSIQNIQAVPVQPVGFSGNLLYPSSIYLSDLTVSFQQTLTHFQIQYAPDELGCDDSCRMRLSAFRGTTQVGTVTTTAPNPGTYPVHTIQCTFAQGFDNVVVHYDAPPPTCQDHGVIFLADNMSVTLAPAGVYAPFGGGCAGTLPPAQLLAQHLPRLGTTMNVNVTNLPQNAAFMLTGWSNTMSGFGALPLDTTSLGMPGCTAYTSVDAEQLLIGTGGVAVYHLTIPNLIGLVGLSMYQQALVLDAGAGNTLGAVMSAPSHLVVGL